MQGIAIRSPLPARAMLFSSDSVPCASCASFLLLAAVWLLPGCSKPVAPAGAAHKSPAKVEVIPHETELATVTLTAEAAGRLGISTQPVARFQVARRRTFAGEALVPSGNSIIVAAPVPGIIAAIGSGRGLPVLGSRVDAAQSVMILKPLLSPERDVPTPAEQVQMAGAQANLAAALVTAQGEVQRSQSEVAGLKIARERATQLFDDRAGSRRAVDDAEAQLNIARSVLAASRQREQELSRLLESLDQSTARNSDGSIVASPLTLTAPVKGIIRAVHVSPGQNVTAGSALFEVVNLDTVWIRVPVYVDLLSQLAGNEAARLVALDGGPLQDQASPRNDMPAARPIDAPPTADAASSTADIYFEVDNRVIGLRPNQRVGVQLPLKATEKASAIPSAAVLYDIYGGTWVYVAQPTASETGEAVFVRQRVTLDWVEGDRAIISTGPSEGAQVVVDGAAELFGTEFGAGK